MSDINPISGPAAVSAPLAADARRQATVQTVPASSTPTDKAEFSEVARYLSKLAENPVRNELIDNVKGEINTSSYVTSDKIDALLDELLSDLDV